MFALPQRRDRLARRCSPYDTAAYRSPPAETTTIDVRPIPRPMRHPLIFNTFDRLDRDESIHVVSDHDPRPLRYLFDVRYSGAFTWDYVEEGPDAWCVRIGRCAPAEAG
ncbi:MAG: DUF2249 domain-containing protein [Tardiphaga sp.]